MTAREFGQIMALMRAASHGKSSDAELLRWWDMLRDVPGPAGRSACIGIVKYGARVEREKYDDPREADVVYADRVLYELCKRTQDTDGDRESEELFTKLFTITRDALKRMTYPQYLETMHWSAMRIGTIVHHNCRCVRCGSFAELEAHHASYARIGNEADDDLVLYCRPCHAAQHPDKSPSAAAIFDAVFRGRSV